MLSYFFTTPKNATATNNSKTSRHFYMRTHLQGHVTPSSPDIRTTFNNPAQTPIDLTHVKITAASEWAPHVCACCAAQRSIMRKFCDAEAASRVEHMKHWGRLRITSTPYSSSNPVEQLQKIPLPSQLKHLPSPSDVTIATKITEMQLRVTSQHCLRHLEEPVHRERDK